jgi:hypothetical protein
MRHGIGQRRRCGAVLVRQRAPRPGRADAGDSARWRLVVRLRGLRRDGAMSPRRSRLARQLALQTHELATAVPQVVAHRLARIALAGPKLSERDRKEFARMVAEKNSAFSESWNAMALQALRSHQALSLSLTRSLWTAPSLRNKAVASVLAVELHNAALGVFGKGLAPVHRKAVANAKRLARTKLR